MSKIRFLVIFAGLGLLSSCASSPRTVDQQLDRDNAAVMAFLQSLSAVRSAGRFAVSGFPMGRSN